MELRPYQTVQYNQLSRILTKYSEAGLFSAVGSGKTLVASTVISGLYNNGIIKKVIKELNILTSNTEAAYKIRDLKTEIKTLNRKLEQIELNEQEDDDDDDWAVIVGFIMGMVIGVILAGVIF